MHKDVENAFEGKEGHEFKAPPLDDISEENRFALNMPGQEFVDLVGADNTRALLGYFEEALGKDAPVTSIQLQRFDNPDEIHHGGFHVDHKNAMVVFLGGENLQGGGITYVDQDGRHDIDQVVPGSAVVHGARVLHGALSHTGKRFTAVLYSKEEAKPEDCILKNLVN